MKKANAVKDDLRQEYDLRRLRVRKLGSARRSFGGDTPIGRPGQPEEVAPSYVFLASDDGSYFSGQVLHPNGGEVVNG